MVLENFNSGLQQNFLQLKQNKIIIIEVIDRLSYYAKNYILFNKFSVQFKTHKNKLYC